MFSSFVGRGCRFDWAGARRAEGARSSVRSGTRGNSTNLRSLHTAPPSLQIGNLSVHSSYIAASFVGASILQLHLWETYFVHLQKRKRLHQKCWIWREMSYDWFHGKKLCWQNQDSAKTQKWGIWLSLMWTLCGSYSSSLVYLCLLSMEFELKKKVRKRVTLRKFR